MHLHAFVGVVCGVGRNYIDLIESNQELSVDIVDLDLSVEHVHLCPISFILFGLWYGVSDKSSVGHDFIRVLIVEDKKKSKHGDHV